MSESCEESCDVHRHEIRKARKGRKCSACRALILPGHYYAYVFTLFDGNPESFARCGSCEVTWQHLKMLCDELNVRRRNYDLLYPLEDLSCGKSYEEEWGDIPDEIAALPLLSDAERGALLAPKVAP